MVKVIHAVSVMDRAGQETFLMNVYRNIDREQVQFAFQCSVEKHGDYDEEIEQLGGKLLYLGENKIKFPVLKYLGAIQQQYRFFKKHKEYDVFHIHTYHAFDAWLCIVGAKLGGMKNIVLHSHNTSGLHAGLHKIFRKLLKYMRIERCACSKEAAKWMYGEKELGRVTIVNNGIEPQKFAFDQEKREQKRAELGLKEKFVVGHIGRFNYQKNHKFLLDVFYEVQKRREDAVLLLIGTGELEAEIVKKVSELKIEDKVKFLGVRSDVQELLWAMDIFLFPSLFEGLSVVAIEAQATGVPILAADTLSPETKITTCMEFLALEKPTEEWAEKVLEMGMNERKDTQKDIQKAGYVIEDVAQMLETKYCNF